MEITMDDLPIREHPFDVTVKPANATKASKCTVDGSGARTAVAGSEATFIVQSKDAYGNNRNTGGDQFDCVLKKVGATNDDSHTVTAEVVDFGNGQYSVSYVCPESGVYDLFVAIGDEKLAICPLKVNVKDAGISDPNNCTIKGDNLNNAVAGQLKTFQLVAKDKLGNPRETGGEDFVAILTQTSAGHIIDVDVLDLNNGTYELSFTPSGAAEYELEIMLGESLIKGTPFKVNVQPQQRGCARCCTISGDGSVTATAGEEATFIIQARDKFGNARKEGGEQFRVTLSRPDVPEPVAAQVKDLNNGQYEVKYMVTKSGNWDIKVEFKEKERTEEERAAELEIRRREREHAIKVREHKKLLAAAAPAASSPGDAGISQGGFDEEEERRKKEEELLASLIAGGDELGEGSVSESPKAEKPMQESSYANKSAAEPAAVEEEQDDDLYKTPEWEEVTTVQVDVNEAGETVPENCDIEGEGVIEAVSGLESSFVIRARDKFGNLRYTGGEKFSVSMQHKKTGNKLATMVTDLGNGTYKVSYTPKDWGEYSLNVKLNKKQIGNTRTVRVSEPTSITALSADEFAKLTDFDIMRRLKAEAEDVGDDNLILEIQELKNRVISQIKENNGLERSLKTLDRKIELLIKNRVTLQEVMKQSSGIKKFMDKFNKNRNKTGAAQSSGLGGIIDDRKKLEAYSNLFYLLQTEPHYLAKCVFLIQQEQLDSFLETVILTLYGFAFSSREEYLILNLFKLALDYEVGAIPSIGGFLESNPVVTKMVLTYGSRLQGKEFLKESLYPLIKPIIDDQDLNLEINPVKIMKDMISADEIKKGVKSSIKQNDVTNEIAMANPEVVKILNERVAKLKELCDKVLNGIIAAKNAIPYGLRWVCKHLATILKKKYPESTDTVIMTVIGYLVYYRFMNPAIIQPDAYELTSAMINQVTRRNLVLVAKILQNLTNNSLFGSASLEKFMEVFNPYITENSAKVTAFFQDVCNVPEPEEQLGVHKYVELTQKHTPTISISINEIFSTHSVILDFVDKLAPADDDPLRKILEVLGAPQQQVPDELDEELNLPLINKFEKDVEKNELSPQQVYEETKEMVRRALRNLPVDNFSNSLLETLERNKKWAEDRMKSAVSKNGGDKKEDKKKQQSAAAADDDDDDADGVESFSAAECEALLKLINQIFQNLPILEKASIATPKDQYATILKDIARDARNRNEQRARQKKELERLQQSLKELQQHYTFLKDQNSNYSQYLSNARDQSLSVKVKPGKKAKAASAAQKIGPYKFTYAQLEKKGVIISLDVPKSQRGKVKFAISSNTPGVFEVAAQVAGVTLKTIELELDDLLEKQYNGVDKVDFEYVSLDVNMCIHVLNQLVAGGTVN
eukprot:GEZU01013749.1.p1 GENE.GEZU01013749.1~~GEZU01013749.1.p1  ORF type:complete len:1370 (-),score=732.55 GEZU01013749.1:189-4298(-)